MKKHLLIGVLTGMLFLLALGCSSDNDGPPAPLPDDDSVELEYITGTIESLTGEHSFAGILDKSFEERKAAGQIMIVSSGNTSAEYVYSDSKWMPKSFPFRFSSEAGTCPIHIKIYSKKPQDGTASGLLAGDELVYSNDKQGAVGKIENIQFKHSHALVEFTFPNAVAEAEIMTTSLGQKPYADKNNGIFGVFVSSGTEAFMVNYMDGGAYSSGEVAVDGGFADAKVYKASVNDGEGTPLMPQWNGFVSYTGPFVFHNANSTSRILDGYVGSGAKWNYVEVDNIKNLQALNVYSSDLEVRFKVDLHDTPADEITFTQAPQKVLVAADFHGQLGAFLDLLTSQGVIDQNYAWSYGTNYLIVNGDTFDRGRDDVTILWLLYKLEKEAYDAGGRCLYLIGNHDDMVLRNKLSYIHEDHGTFASSYTGAPSFDQFWTSSTELGRWVRSRNIMVTVGRDAYLHAGIYKTIVDDGFTIEEINQVGKSNTGNSSKYGRAATIFDSNSDTGGLLWYRGMAKEIATSQEVDNVLVHFDIDRVIVGHTEVNEIAWKYNGRVVAVNVKHATNWANSLNGSSTRTTGALLIENGNYYSVDYKGNVVQQLN